MSSDVQNQQAAREAERLQNKRLEKRISHEIDQKKQNQFKALLGSAKAAQAQKKDAVKGATARAQSADKNAHAKNAQQHSKKSASGAAAFSKHFDKVRAFESELQKKAAHHSSLTT